ncbi:MAG: hypothetical protein JJE22_01740 [Bacteroidia bacterium]|nr:hypothetical protein [Bacteroidia bacterium]
MKKFIVSILSFLYITTSTGATIHFHYCMGKLVGWDLSHNPTEKCGKCGMKIKHQLKRNACCHDEYKQIKNDKDQKLSAVEPYLLHPVIILSSNFQSELLSLIACIKSETIPVSNAPPGSPGAIYIRNCVFLI